MNFKLLISTAVFHFASGITLSCVPGVPEYQSNMTCTCTNPTKNGIEWRLNSQIVTTCSSTVDNSCFPPSLEYTSSVSSDEFYFEISRYSYTDCATYSCRDPSTGEEISATTSIADFDQRNITAEEPEANTDGQIKIITGCVFPTSDITVTWYKIKKGKEEDFTSSRPSPIQSSDRSDCTRTCNTVTDKKVESGFTHTEYTGSDYVEVTYKATVTHNLYMEGVYTWTSLKYRLKAGLSGDCEVFKSHVIASIALGIASIIALVVSIVIAKKCSNKLISLVIGVLGFVLDITSLGLSASVLADDNYKDCEDWIFNLAIAFVAITSIVAVTDIVVFYFLLKSGKLKGIYNTIKQEACFQRNIRNNLEDNIDTHRGTLSERATSDGEVSRRDVHVQERTGDIISRRQPMPPIPLTDNKGRGLSANYDDDDLPVISVGIPEKKKGDLRSLGEEPKKKKKKKKKATSDDDDDDYE